MNRSKKITLNTYGSLVYDEFGGVILDISKDKINPERWNNDILNYNVSETELNSLQSVIQFLCLKNIKIVIAISPQREGLITNGNMIRINTELNKISRVVKNQKGIFINSFDAGNWSDSLFVDYTHLNRVGTIKYTNFIVNNSGLILY